MPLMKSWVASANGADCPFPLNNLPYGSFEHRTDEMRGGVCVAIGDQVLDLSQMDEDGALRSTG